MNYFRVIIPSYNNGKLLKRAVDSVKAQTFKNYSLLVVDDCSDDLESIKTLTELDAPYVSLEEKAYNGGARNRGMDLAPDALYTLFLDADDAFVDENLFAELNGFIEMMNRPDIIRLPLMVVDETGKASDMTKGILENEHNLVDLAGSMWVACWTKCVKTKKLVKFPENTLMEDVVQHLAQCDVVDSYAAFPRAFCKWYRYPNKTTSTDNSPKWKSSAYRYMADLMDLKLNRQYTEDRRHARIIELKYNLNEGIYLQ